MLVDTYQRFAETELRPTSVSGAALAYAEAVTSAGRFPEAEHFERLRRHFDDDALLELTALVAFQNLSSKFNTALGVEAQGLCAIAASRKATEARTSVTV